MPKNKDFITLKEAAKISGYSADYLGQLIRSGKLPGKQVFSNVAWVTTEDDVVAYMKNGGKAVDVSSEGKGTNFLSGMLHDEARLLQLYRAATFVLGGLLLIAVLFLTYVAIVTFDRSIDQKFLEEAGHYE